MLDLYANFKNYFVTKDPDIQSVVDTIDYESFLSLYDSLEDEEAVAFDNTLHLTEAQEMSVFLIMMKVVLRYLDYGAGHTDMDDDGLLHISHKSNILELPIAFNTYIELSSLLAQDIESAYKAANCHLLSEEAAKDLKDSYKLVKEADYIIIDNKEDLV